MKIIDLVPSDALVHPLSRHRPNMYFAGRPSFSLAVVTAASIMFLAPCYMILSEKTERVYLRYMCIETIIEFLIGGARHKKSDVSGMLADFQVPLLSLRPANKASQDDDNVEIVFLLGEHEMKGEGPKIGIICAILLLLPTPLLCPTE